jgi:hypothetical protein
MENKPSVWAVLVHAPAKARRLTWSEVKKFPGTDELSPCLTRPVHSSHHHTVKEKEKTP